jgi:carbon-monoxide dehydrogenase medium subunit
MKFPEFDYARPETLAEACALMSGPGAKILAGGQSLFVSILNTGVAPALLVDINRISALHGIEQRGNFLRIGALVRYSEINASTLVQSAVPLLFRAVSYVASLAVRNRGTVCGSLAFADPAAEMPACAVALNAMFILASANGTRQLPARDFYLGRHTTACGAGEMVSEVLFPMAAPTDRFGFAEIALRCNDPPAIGIAIHAWGLSDLDVVLFGAEQKTLLWHGRDLHFWDGPESRAWLVEDIIAGMRPVANLQGSQKTKLTQARTLLARTLASMAQVTDAG